VAFEISIFITSPLTGYAFVRKNLVALSVVREFETDGGVNVRIDRLIWL
jgi:hypothetical protein